MTEMQCILVVVLVSQMYTFFPNSLSCKIFIYFFKDLFMWTTFKVCFEFFTVSFLFYVFGFWATRHVGSQLPNHESNRHPLHWKPEVLTTWWSRISLFLFKLAKADKAIVKGSQRIFPGTLIVNLALKTLNREQLLITLQTEAAVSLPPWSTHLVNGTLTWSHTMEQWDWIAHWSLVWLLWISGFSYRKLNSSTCNYPSHTLNLSPR